MDRIDPTMLATWKCQVQIADELLAEIAAGATRRPYLGVEVEAIRAERARFLALIASVRRAAKA